MGDIRWEYLNPNASERFRHENTCHERRVVGQGEVEAFGSVSDLTLRAPERVVGAPLAQGIGDSTGADDLHFTAGVCVGTGGVWIAGVISNFPPPRRAETAMRAKEHRQSAPTRGGAQMARSYDGLGSRAKPSAASRSRPRWSSPRY